MSFYKYLISVQSILQMLIFMGITTRNFVDTENFENYGPYTVDYSKWINCAGPKSKNLTYSNVELTKFQDNYVANISMTFLTQCHIDEVKIKAFRVEKNQKRELFNYKIDNPCQHYTFASVIKKYFSADKCIVKKGTYNLNLLLNNVTRLFYGKSTFYGEFQTKSIVTSKQGNIFCWVLNTIFNKAMSA